MQVVELPRGQLARVAEIDRSERVRESFEVVAGRLRPIPVDWDVPSWDAAGHGPHSIGSVLDAWQPVVDGGGVLLGVESDAGLAGMSIVVPEWEPGRAWLAFMYVTRPWRRRGLAAAMWDECERRARSAGAATMYISAIPSGPAVCFYLSRGCELATDPHPVLAAAEPDDIQLVKQL